MDSSDYLVISAPKIEPATLSIVFGANTSPLAGQEGKKLTSRQIKERLLREAEVNVGIKVIDHGETVEVLGRGDLQLGVLIENMRREGFELNISATKILFKEENGKKLEPIEEVQIDVDQPFMSVVIQKLTERGGELKEIIERKSNVRLIFHVPTRLLLGYSSEFLSDTKGTGVMNKQLVDYAPYNASKELHRKSVIVSMSDGTATGYAIEKLLDRGCFFIEPGTKVYGGMIVGENNKSGGDLEVNVVKAKQLTNVRASGKDDAIKLPPASIMSLEKAITYIKSDESVEVTPLCVRLRKNKLI
jgi:GTP-binding protein